MVVEIQETLITLIFVSIQKRKRPNCQVIIGLFLFEPSCILMYTHGKRQVVCINKLGQNLISSHIN